MALRGLIFYTVNEVSEIMQVRVETVLRWIYANKIKASKLPGSRIWRIREEDIVDFMERGANTRNDFKEDELGEEIEDVLLDLGYTEEIKKPNVNKKNSNNKKTIKSNKDDFESYESDEEITKINYKDMFEDNSKRRLASNTKIDKAEIFNEGTSLNPNSKPTVKKSDIIKMKDGNYVTANKLNTGEEKVVDEFVFDEEQASKPIEEDIALIMISEKDIHICDDQEENIKEIKRSGLGKSQSF